MSTAKQPASGDLAAAVRDGDYPRALDLALKRWNQSRARPLGDLIEQLSGRAPEKAPALASADPREQSIGDMQTLVTSCAGLPPDPRIAGAMTRMLLHPPFTSMGSRGVWTPLLELLGDRHADPRTLDALEPVAADYMRIFGATKMGERMQRGVSKVVEALKKRFDVVPTDAEAQELLAGLSPAAAAPPAPKSKATTGEELLALVYENPDDDAPRLVYADWLLEHGDPRGEFITLQFRRHRGETLSPEEETREQQLLKKHVKEWLGPVHAVTRRDGDVFARGFLDRAHFQPRGAATALALDHPAWATVRVLSINSNGTQDFGEDLMAQPVMRRLRELRDCNGSLLETLVAQEDLALETLHYTWTGSRRDPAAGARAWARLLAGEGLPNLRHLVLGAHQMLAADALRAFLLSPRATRLRQLSLPVWGQHDAAQAVLRETPAPSATFEVYVPQGGKEALRFSRGPDGNLSSVAH